MGGPTLLWRDSSAVALALLLWGRGIEALLRWQGGNGGGAAAVVTGVIIDPRGPSPLEVGPFLEAACGDAFSVDRSLLPTTRRSSTARAWHSLTSSK